MKRRIAVVAVLAGLLAPAGALADSARSGPGKRGFEVALQIAYEGNKPKVIKKFIFDNVVVTCESGPAPNPFTTDSLPPHFGPMSVNREGRFGRVFSSNNGRFDGSVVIRGEFLTRRKLEGTLKIKGDYPNAGYENCSSGRLDWTAEIG